MSHNPAPLKRRFAALGIDYLIIVGYGVVLLGCALLFYHLIFGGVPDQLASGGPFASQLIAFTTLTLPIALYFYFTESGRHNASFGKRLAKIKITSVTSRSVAKHQIAARTIVKFLPWEFAHTFVQQFIYYSQNGGTAPAWVMVGLTIANILPVVYVGIVLFQRDHRGPHDLIANTLVVSAK